MFQLGFWPYFVQFLYYKCIFGLHIFLFWTRQFIVWIPHFGRTAHLRYQYTLIFRYLIFSKNIWYSFPNAAWTELFR